MLIVFIFIWTPGTKFQIHQEDTDEKIKYSVLTTFVLLKFRIICLYFYYPRYKNNQYKSGFIIKQIWFVLYNKTKTYVQNFNTNQKLYKHKVHKFRLITIFYNNHFWRKSKICNKKWCKPIISINVRRRDGEAVEGASRLTSCKLLPSCFKIQSNVGVCFQRVHHQCGLLQLSYVCVIRC